jgi:hypothetical protein
LIRQGADQSKDDASKVRDEAEALEGRVAVTANKIKELEALAAKDEELTTMVSTAVAGYIIPCRSLLPNVDNQSKTNSVAFTPQANYTEWPLLVGEF